MRKRKARKFKPRRRRDNTQPSSVEHKAKKAYSRPPPLPRRRQRIQNDAALSDLDSKPVDANPRPPPPRYPFYYRDEVAAIIDRTTVQLWQYVRDGKISKPHKHGNRPIWFQSQIDEYFANLPECKYKPKEELDAA
jgi:hypothetical protein